MKKFDFILEGRTKDMKIANDVNVDTLERERESNTFRCKKLGIFVLQFFINNIRKYNRKEIYYVRTHWTCMFD